ncbi:MAG TPA: hypothetical protein VG797_03410 [Phycisphaerales bacterium]|nr:hypothetical protein [Phycisphaerales bacterium]
MKNAPAILIAAAHAGYRCAGVVKAVMLTTHTCQRDQQVNLTCDRGAGSVCTAVQS